MGGKSFAWAADPQDRQQILGKGSKTLRWAASTWDGMGSRSLGWEANPLDGQEILKVDRKSLGCVINPWDW